MRTGGWSWNSARTSKLDILEFGHCMAPESNSGGASWINLWSGHAIANLASRWSCCRKSINRKKQMYLVTQHVMATVHSFFISNWRKNRKTLYLLNFFRNPTAKQLLNFSLWDFYHPQSFKNTHFSFQEDRDKE